MSQQDTHELEDGFYWVRFESEWVVMQVEGGCRFICGSDMFWDIIDFDEIDPRPIVRPE